MDSGLASVLNDDALAVGTWLSVGHPTVAELATLAGPDFLLIDLEHTPTTYETALEMVRATEAADPRVAPVIRPRANDRPLIQRALDLGIPGVMIPMIADKAEAKAAVSACQYPPIGTRGVAGTRPAEYGAAFGQYVQTADEAVTVILQIETEAAVENVDQIASVEGVDALFVGPSDLTANLGIFGEADHDTYRRAVERVRQAGEKHGLPVGTLAVGEWQVRDQLDLGFDFIIAGKDEIHLRKGIEDTVRLTRQVSRDL